MKKASIFIVILCSFLEMRGQQKITVYQRCGNKDLTVFFKAGSASDGAVGRTKSDSSIEYNIPLDEPRKISILIDEETRYFESFWIDPRFKNRKLLIDNCNKTFFKLDTIPEDKDDAPYCKIEDEYKLGLFSLDSFDRGTTYYQEQYTKNQPDSFLALHYLRDIMNSISINKTIAYFKTLNPAFSKYSDYKEIESYIANYKYKSVPKIGDPFYEFQALTPSGKTFDSKTISDKVVVMYFCYSGCGPCKRAAEPLRQVYERYKKSNVEFISFSFDKDTAQWHKTVSEHVYPGFAVSDLVGFNSPIFLHYNVTAFPFFIVFDRNKKISMITYGEDEVPLVETKVKELIGQ